MKPVRVLLIIVGMLIFGTSLCFASPNPNGDFIVADFEDGTGFNNPWAALSLVNLDGNGTGTYEELYTSDPPPYVFESGSFTYSIADDGQLTIYAGSFQFHGIVSADGNTLTVAVIETDGPGILFGIKESAVKINANPGIPLLLLDE